jgi:hypothetical protein
MNKKILFFTFRGEQYGVDELGRIQTKKLGHYSDHWLFLGGKKQVEGGIMSVSLHEAFNCPSMLNECIGLDVDHGTIREWGGLENGKTPTISKPYVVIY